MSAPDLQPRLALCCILCQVHAFAGAHTATCCRAWRSRLAMLRADGGAGGRSPASLQKTGLACSTRCCQRARRSPACAAQVLVGTPACIYASFLRSQKFPCLCSKFIELVTPIRPARPARFSSGLACVLPTLISRLTPGADMEALIWGQTAGTVPDGGKCRCDPSTQPMQSAPTCCQPENQARRAARWYPQGYQGTVDAGGEAARGERAAAAGRARPGLLPLGRFSGEAWRGAGTASV